MNFEYKMIKKTSGSVAFELSDKTAEFFVKHWFNNVVSYKDPKDDYYSIYKEAWRLKNYRNNKSQEKEYTGILNFLSDIVGDTLRSYVDPLKILQGDDSWTRQSSKFNTLSKIWSFSAFTNGEPPRQLRDELQKYCRDEFDINVSIGRPQLGNIKGDWFKDRSSEFDSVVERLYFKRKYQEMFDYFFDPKYIIKFIKLTRC